MKPDSSGLAKPKLRGVIHLVLIAAIFTVFGITVKNS